MNLTVGQLKEMLSQYNDDVELSFSGLDFYRLKWRDNNLVQIEFNQSIYKDPKTGKVIVENIEQ